MKKTFLQWLKNVDPKTIIRNFDIFEHAARKNGVEIPSQCARFVFDHYVEWMNPFLSDRCLFELFTFKNDQPHLIYSRYIEVDELFTLPESSRKFLKEHYRVKFRRVDDDYIVLHELNYR
jgi:hypothetical protein